MQCLLVPCDRLECPVVAMQWQRMQGWVTLAMCREHGWCLHQPLYPIFVTQLWCLLCVCSCGHLETRVISSDTLGLVFCFFLTKNDNSFSLLWNNQVSGRVPKWYHCNAQMLYWRLYKNSWPFFFTQYTNKKLFFFSEAYYVYFLDGHYS